MNRYRDIDRIGAIIIRDKKLLLVTGSGTGYFWTPGGKREKEESHIDALKREIDEEMSVQINVKDKEPYISYYDVRETIFYPIQNYCYLADFQGEIVINDEIEEHKWFTKEDFFGNDYNFLNSIKKILVPKLIEDGLL